MDVPAPGSPESNQPAGPIDAPQDLTGCFLSAFRAAGCMASLYLIMFFAIAAAALLSLMFFR